MSENNRPADLTDVYNILVHLHDIRAEQLALSKSKRQAPAATVAPDADLDSQYGNEKVNFKPKDYTGPARHRQRGVADDLGFIKGQLMSETNPHMLDALALVYDWYAEKNDAEGNKTDSGKPKSFYDKRSAARARGWAARLRAGWKPKAFAPEPFADGEGPRW